MLSFSTAQVLSERTRQLTLLAPRFVADIESSKKDRVGGASKELNGKSGAHPWAAYKLGRLASAFGDELCGDGAGR
jgi:hypothetical protein